MTNAELAEKLERLITEAISTRGELFLADAVIKNKRVILSALRGVEAAREALAVPQVWSDVEAVGMERAFTDATHKHGLYESLFAAAAWLLRHRAGLTESCPGPHPSLKAATPAPMTAERLASMRNYLGTGYGISGGDLVALFAHIDALTARIAEVLEANAALERARLTLEAELNAARKPPESGEVAEWVVNLRNAALNVRAFSQDERQRYDLVADLLTRQAAALAEAEEKIGRLEGRMCLVCGAKAPCKETPEACTFDPSPIDAAKAFQARALAAEAERDSLRTDWNAAK